ncbi:MAG: 16S rRNA (guanine(966)-N(2))-methyltransferase RsmD [Spirochaetaceae bacterium]|nr:16S rRNA (guanine(966)-N(2))-methyltransferase RsmD [Spirochaetaceae bacterium]
MRITGGCYRGRIVKCPPGEIRPAMDRMRESMFSILGNIEGLSFLDLFAGSGVVALEALSRGADKALLVEMDSGKRKTIMENLKIANEDTDFSTSGSVNLIIRRVEHVLRPGMERFDIIHLDPPFPMKNKEKLLSLADKALQPVAGGTLMIHYPSENKLPETTGNLRLYDKRTYGRSHLAFYTRDN